MADPLGSEARRGRVGTAEALLDPASKEGAPARRSTERAKALLRRWPQVMRSADALSCGSAGEPVNERAQHVAKVVRGHWSQFGPAV